MSDFSSAPPFVHIENIAVSVIMTAIGVIGLVSNGAAIVIVRSNPALQNSFGQLCLSQSIANMGALLVLAFWIAPITLL
ncbi:hypothetical protein KIN20_027201, partial [Parelaphostrongylus tenuis]